MYSNPALHPASSGQDQAPNQYRYPHPNQVKFVNTFRSGNEPVTLRWMPPPTATAQPIQAYIIYRHWNREIEKDPAGLFSGKWIGHERFAQFEVPPMVSEVVDDTDTSEGHYIVFAREWSGAIIEVPQCQIQVSQKLPPQHQAVLRLTELTGEAYLFPKLPAVSFINSWRDLEHGAYLRWEPPSFADLGGAMVEAYLLMRSGTKTPESKPRLLFAGRWEPEERFDSFILPAEVTEVIDDLPTNDPYYTVFAKDQYGRYFNVGNFMAKSTKNGAPGGVALLSKIIGYEIPVDPYPKKIEFKYTFWYEKGMHLRWDPPALGGGVAGYVIFRTAQANLAREPDKLFSGAFDAELTTFEVPYAELTEVVDDTPNPRKEARYLILAKDTRGNLHTIDNLQAIALEKATPGNPLFLSQLQQGGGQ